MENSHKQVGEFSFNSLGRGGIQVRFLYVCEVFVCFVFGARKLEIVFVFCFFFKEDPLVWRLDQNREMQRERQTDTKGWGTNQEAFELVLVKK